MSEWTKGKIINTKAWLNGMELFGDAGENNFLELKLALRNSLDEITRLQSELATEKESHRWIPVEERLPKEYERVIAYNSISSPGGSFSFYGDQKWYFEDDGTKEWINYPPTHWQPLPTIEAIT